MTCNELGELFTGLTSGVLVVRDMTHSPYRSGGFLSRLLRLGRGTGIGLGNTSMSGPTTTGGVD